MFRHRRNLRISASMIAGLLITAASAAYLSPVPMPTVRQAAIFASSLLCAPGPALRAAEQTILHHSEDPGSADTGRHFSESAAVTHSAGFAVPNVFSKPESTPAPPVSSGLENADIPAPKPEPEPSEAVPAWSTAVSQAPAPIPQMPVPDGMLPLIQRFYPQGQGGGYIVSGAATIRNCTDLPEYELAADMMQPLPFSIDVKSGEPQVLIVHTHTTECYESEEHGWCDPSFSARTTNLEQSVASVGDQMAAELESAGIRTIHDKTLHDYPSYTGSYQKSRETVQSYLSRYPSIRIVIDLHRDAIQCQDGTRIKPAVEIDGQKCAQVMLICGADLDGNLPDCRQNLRFASRWQDQMEKMYPGLTRPALFDYRFYNQDLSAGSLLIEVGGHANTLEEARYAGKLAGKALAALLLQPAE